MYEGQDAVQEDEKSSKFNSAALINFRINSLWIDANNHSRAGLYNKWNADLDRVWCELVGDVKKESKEKAFEELNKDASEKLLKLPSAKEGFATYTKQQKKDLAETYQALLKKEEFIRKLQNTQGKGTAYDEDDDFE